MSPPPETAQLSVAPISRAERMMAVGVQVGAFFCGLIALGPAVVWPLGWWSYGTFGRSYVPMAPSTAWLLVLLACALLLHARRPNWRAARICGGAVVGLVGAAGLLVLSRDRLPLAHVFEGWLAPTTERVDGIPVGRMSEYTAVAFLLAAGALGALLGSRRWPRLCRVLALMLGLVVSGGSAHVIASYALGMPLLYGSGLIPMALLTAIAFCWLGAGFVAATHPERWLMEQFAGLPAGAGAGRARWFGWALVGIFLVLVSGIAVAGFLYLRRELVAARHNAEDRLSAVANLKTKRIQEWRNDILGDAAWILHGSSLGKNLRQWREVPGDQAARARLEDWLQAWRQYQGGNSVLLLDAEGRVLLAAPAEAAVAAQCLPGHVARAITEKEPQLADLHLESAGSSRVRMAVVVPLFDEVRRGGAADGVLVIELDPARFLFPMIEEWPTPSRTAETLLVRREGDEIVYLNELRHRKGTALKLVLPVARGDLPATRAVLGEEGVVDGVDYRGVPVLAALRRIPDSPWFIVAKQDTAEFLAPLRQQAWSAGVAVGALMLAVALGLALLWRHRERRFVEQELAVRAVSDNRVRVSEERFRSLFTTMSEGAVLHELVRDAQGVPVDYRLVELNPAFERHTGLPVARARGILGSVLYAVNPPPYLDRYVEVATTGIARSFEEFFAPLGRHFQVSVFSPGKDRFATVFQDITERRCAEQEREALLSDLEQANSELEAMLYVASHDLRAPLVNLQGFGQRLEKSCGELAAELRPVEVPPAVRERLDRILDERIPGALKYIRTSVEKMDALINGLLKVSRLGRADMSIRPVDMDRLIRDVIAGQAFQIQTAGAEVQVGPLPACRGDAALLNQVFANLLDNALKYRDPARPLRVHFSGRNESDRVVYEVADNGVGIAPQHQDRIWELFHRLHPEGAAAGEGLGLNLVRRILDRHRGRIQVESVPGQGSRFFVTLKAN